MHHNLKSNFANNWQKHQYWEPKIQCVQSFQSLFVLGTPGFKSLLKLPQLMFI